jgi:hypothetical protein
MRSGPSQNQPGTLPARMAWDPVWTGLDRPGSGLARPMPASDDILGLHMPYWVILVTQDEPGRVPGQSWVTRMTQYELCRSNISSEQGIGVVRPDRPGSRPVQTGLDRFGQVWIGLDPAWPK